MSIPILDYIDFFLLSAYAAWFPLSYLDSVRCTHHYYLDAFIRDSEI
jgi:hypothetical protein